MTSTTSNCKLPSTHSNWDTTLVYIASPPVLVQKGDAAAASFSSPGKSAVCHPSGGSAVSSLPPGVAVVPLLSPGGATISPSLTPYSLEIRPSIV